MNLGLALIARDEEQNLPHLLASVEGVFDQVVLLDTGSTDKTIDIFVEWAKRQPGMLYKVGRFQWIQDFAAARNEADAMLDTEWRVWADCDDEIKNAGVLRQLAEQAPPELSAYVMGYNYAQTPEGINLCYLHRERLVRAGKGFWRGRVHEAQEIDGAVQFVSPELVEWVHRKGLHAAHEEPSPRNLEILLKWLEDEPENTRVLAYLGTESAVRGKHEDACAYYERYLQVNPDWEEEQAQVCRKYAASLNALGRINEARDKAFRAMILCPNWPDSYLTLAEWSAQKGQFTQAAQWADRVLELGRPQTLLIINPRDYDFLPRKYKAIALGAAEQWDEAVAVGREALAMFPDEDLFTLVNGWRLQSKREHTAATYAMCANQLIAHDEQLKALTLLEECVPYFATDHPSIVGLRSMLRDRLSWVHRDESFAEHYTFGGSKPEDFHTDERADEVAQILPRVDFLLRGLKEQIAA
jgi:tetratricopeptide (TPR) repeat protein